MTLKSRILKLEQKAGAKQLWGRAVCVVSHEHYPKEKLTAFLQENGVDPEDPVIMLINAVIVEPDRSDKGMFEPYFIEPMASTGTEHRPRNTS